MWINSWISTIPPLSKSDINLTLLFHPGAIFTTRRPILRAPKLGQEQGWCAPHGPDTRDTWRWYSAIGEMSTWRIFCFATHTLTAREQMAEPKIIVFDLRPDWPKVQYKVEIFNWGCFSFCSSSHQFFILFLCAQSSLQTLQHFISCFLANFCTTSKVEFAAHFAPTPMAALVNLFSCREALLRRVHLGSGFQWPTETIANASWEWPTHSFTGKATKPRWQTLWRESNVKTELHNEALRIKSKRPSQSWILPRITKSENMVGRNNHVSDGTSTNLAFGEPKFNRPCSGWLNRSLMSCGQQKNFSCTILQTWRHALRTKNDWSQSRIKTEQSTQSQVDICLSKCRFKIQFQMPKTAFLIKLPHPHLPFLQFSNKSKEDYVSKWYRVLNRNLALGGTCGGTFNQGTYQRQSQSLTLPSQMSFGSLLLSQIGATFLSSVVLSWQGCEDQINFSVCNDNNNDHDDDDEGTMTQIRSFAALFQRRAA